MSGYEDLMLTDDERRKLLLSNALLGLGAGLMSSGKGGGSWLNNAGQGLLMGAQMGQTAVGEARRGKAEDFKMREYIAKRDADAAQAQAGAQLNADLANVPPGAAQYEQAMKRAEMAANAGDVKRAEQYQKMAEFYRVKYGLSPQTGMGPDGKPVMFQVSDTGETKALPYGVKPEYKQVDTGGAVKFYDPLTGGSGGEFGKTMTPEGMATDKRAREQMAQSDRHFNANMAAKSSDDRMGKAPPGYRWKSDKSGDLEKIPGGPKDGSEKDEANERNALARADMVIGKIGEIMPNVGIRTAGLGGAILGAIPGSGAYDLSKAVDMVKANIGFQELQAMRQASPTGGALGQVAVQELNMLQSVIASLDTKQSPQQLRQSLGQVQKHFDNWKKIVSQSGPQQPRRQSTGAVDFGALPQ